MKRFLPFPKPKNSLKPLFFLLLLVALILFAFGAMAQAPAVTYRGTLGLAMNAPMTPVSPQNTGGAASMTYPANPVAVGTFTFNIIGAAIDKSGNIYAISPNSRSLFELSNGNVTTAASLPPTPQAIASDTSGNIFVAVRQNIYKIVAGSPVLRGTARANILSLAADPAGNFYVTELDNSASGQGLYKILPGGTSDALVTNTDAPANVCVDRSGNIFYAGSGGQIDEIPALLGFPLQLFQYGEPATDITTDLAGNLYIIGVFVSASATRYNPNTGSRDLVGPTVSDNLSYIVIDANDNMYFPSNAAGFNRRIMAGAPASNGYTVSPALPFGINLDRITGIISGTPIVSVPATNYTVTAANSSGSSTSVINLQTGFVTTAFYGNAAEAYNQNTAISPWVPQVSGAPLTGAAYSAPSVVAVGFNTLAGVSADASGNVYVADKANSYINEIVPGGGNPGGIGSGLSSPAGIVADAAGNVYVADSGNGAIKEIKHSDGSVQTIASALTAPQAIARDVAGNLFVINTTTVYEIAAGQNTATTLVSGLTGLWGIAADVGDNLYITSKSAGKVYKITAGHNTATDMGISLSAPAGIASDNAGNLWITDAGTHSLYKVAQGGNTATLVSASFTAPAGVSAGSDGRIYITDSSTGEIFELVPTGGFYPGQQLPLGLAIDPATGTISGTPQMQSAVTNYTVTMYAGLVPFTATFTISVGAPLVPPTISYENPPGYAQGVAVTPLSPANTGNPATAVTYNGAPQAISFAYANTQQLGQGMARDKAGNIYLADNANGRQILEYTGGQVIQIANGFNSLRGIAVDNAGNVFFTDNSVLYKMAPGGTAAVIASFTDANSVALDAGGNLYVSDEGNFDPSVAGIYKLANDGSNKVKIGGTFSGTIAVAVDSSGNVFASDISDRTLYRIDAVSGLKTALASFTDGTELATDKAGNVYVGDGTANHIYFISAGSISAGNVAPQQIATLAASPQNQLGGITTDAANNLYIAYVNTNHLNEVDKYARTGGFSVSPALPTGLALDNNTGIISGTPTAASPATTYTVTAVNSQGSGTAGITIQVGPAPAISYAGPETYAVNTAITALSPSSTGGAVTTAGYSTTPALLVSGLNMPGGLAADTAGKIYITDKGNNAVKVASPSGGNPVVIGSGFNAPSGLVVDNGGNVYVADSGNGAIKEIPQGNGAIQTLVTGLTAPQYITRDGAGNLFVANTTTIYEIASGSGTATMLVTGFTNLTGISVDGNDNLYISGSGKVYKMKVGNNTPVDLGLSITAPAGVAVDASGNLFITDSNTHALYEVAAGGNSAVVLTAGFSSPTTVSVGADGKIYISDPGAGKALELSPTGGFYLNQSLPQGLVMDPNTGTISGTPKKQSSTASYTITAYAGLVSASTSVTITVGPQAVPLISYQNPAAYVLGAAITPLSPINAGGAVATLTYATPVDLLPYGENFDVAADNQGNVFVASDGEPGITEFMAKDGSYAQYCTSISCVSVAADSAGNIYFADRNNIYRVARGSNDYQLFGPGNYSDPLRKITVDGTGIVFGVATSSDDTNIFQIARDGSSFTTLYNNPLGTFGVGGMAADAHGNLYFGDVPGHAIREIPAGTTSVVTLATGMHPQKITVDNLGNIYEADLNSPNASVNLIPAGGGSVISLISWAAGGGIAIDGAGNLYLGTTGDGGGVDKATPAGGYFISRPLPLGLNMDRTTGIISGTPATATASAAYTITAYNSNGSSSANIILATGQPPVISYTGPQAYAVGVAITALSPANSGAAVTAAGYSTLPFVFAGGLGRPQQIATDAAGNVYVADKAKNMVTKIPAGGGTGVCIGGGFNKPTGVAVDKAGNVYVADAGNGAVKEIPVAGGFMTTIGSGVTTPSAVALDTLGNIYIADVTTVYKVTPGGVQTTLTTGFSSLTALAISPDNKSLYATDASGAVYRIIISKSPVEAVQLGVSFTSPAGIAMDNAGNLYVADAGARQVYEIAAGQTQSVSMGLSFSGSSSPSGMEVDNSGNIYFADAGTGQIREITLSGGYYLNKPLPDGLSMSSNTGTISGTPKTASTAANYGVTAYAGSIPGKATLNIAVTGGVPPTFTYEGVPALALGVPITPVTPVVTSGGIGQYAYNGTPLIFGIGVTATGKIAVDSLGNVYVADMPDNSVAEIFSSGGLTRLASFINHPNGITKDRQNNVWVANGQIVETIGQQVSRGNYQNPVTVGTDLANNIYVGDLGLGGVFRMDKNGNNQVKIDHGIAHPDALAADAAGDVYVVSSIADSLYVIQANGGAQRALAHFNTPTQVAVDPFGDIFVAENAGYIYFVPAGGSTPLLLNQTPYANVTGIGVDGGGDLFVGQSTISGVNKLTPTGGYFQNGGLPAGLVLDHTTGVISGTPTTAWVHPGPITAFPFFTIDGFNAAGHGSAVLNVEIGAPPSFTYATPQTLYKGVTGAPVSPINGGTQVSAMGYSYQEMQLLPETLSTGGIAVDKAGNIYLADKTDNMIAEYPPSGKSVCLGTGFKNPAGITLDQAGNLYVADQGNAAVKMIPAGGGIIKTIGNGFTAPAAVAPTTRGTYL